MKKLFLLTLVAMSVFTAKAQLVTKDANWCNAIEKAFEAQGIAADVNCDMDGHDKILRVAVDGKTTSIPLEESNHKDFSSTICITVEPIISRQLAQNIDVHVWPLKSNNEKVDVVYVNPNDDAYLFETLQNALGDIPRIKIIDNNYSRSAANEATIYTLKCNVLSMLHGERFKELKEKEGEARRGNAKQEVDRYLAYLEANLQLLDYNTGEILWQKRIKDSNYTSSTLSDPMEDCRNTVARTLRDALSSMYPTTAPRVTVRGTVVKIDDPRKEKVTGLYIDVGEDNRVKEGDTFNLYAQYEINGNSGEHQIGVVQVTDVEGDSLAHCKVKKGDRDIYSAVQDELPLIVVSNW